MEHFRWILLIAGLLLLVYIYLSGRNKRNGTNYLSGRSKDDADPLFTDHRSERKMSDRGEPFQTAQDFDDFDPIPGDEEQPFDEDLDFFKPLEGMPEPRGSQSQTRLFSSIAEKIEAFSARLTPKRKERIEASAARAKNKNPAEAGEEKIISLNVMAYDDDVLDGAELYAVFSQRGYEFGDMGLFHSRYKGRTIFSIVNMVEPGSFELETIDSLQTPGITLFLQLPGPIAADVLFEVLVSEASDIARALGATVRDSQRSTLTKQTIQHLRESIYEYMHREKYFGSRPH
ncbi:MAG: hypothetical protein KDJ38_05195 [Gammaproteobacteria bacterium]|nr:hypothetical protein [Gammaproteobacteria bacterium]